MSVRISVESVSGWSWNGCPDGRGIRSFMVQHFFIKTLKMLEQLRSEAAQLFGVELIERRSRNHGDDSARSADRCMSSISFNEYG